jgi:nitroreductase
MEAKMDDGTREAFDQLVRTRRSIRRFTSRPVSKKLLIEILDIAGNSPSNSNMQPWRVYLVGGAAKDKLAQALSEAHQKSPANYQPERPMYAPNLPAPYSDRLQQFGRVFYDALAIDRADMEARGRQTARNLIFLVRRLPHSSRSTGDWKWVAGSTAGFSLRLSCLQRKPEVSIPAPRFF